MTQSSNILQELKELESTLAGTSPQNAYTVPNGYFEGLAGEVLNRIRAIEASTASEELTFLSPLLGKASKEMPYVVPAGYFDEVDERIMQTVRKDDDRTAAEELESISPLLSSLKKEMPFSVPEGYFDNLISATGRKENKQPVAKVVSITRRSWLRYAAAAIVIGVVATVGLVVLNNGRSIDKKIAKEIKKASDKELNDFIQYTDAGQDLAFNGNKEEIKEMLKDVPATELQNFLDEIADPEMDIEEKPVTE